MRFPLGSLCLEVNLIADRTFHASVNTFWGMKTVISRWATVGTQKSHFWSRKQVPIFSCEMLAAHLDRPRKPRRGRLLPLCPKPLDRPEQPLGCRGHHHLVRMVRTLAHSLGG